MLLLLLALLTLNSPAFADDVPTSILHVPEDYPSIGDALTAAVDGDQVVVAPGTYEEHHLDPRGKAVVIRSTDPYDPETVEGTVIDAVGRGYVLRMGSGEGRETVVLGLTLRGGSRTGITLTGSAPSILRCRILDCYSPNDGGAVRGTDASPLFRDCLIRGNGAFLGGAAMYFQGGGAVDLVGCIIEHNGQDAAGGAIVVGRSVGLQVADCVFSDNRGGAIHVIGEGDVSIRSSEFTGNGPDHGAVRALECPRLTIEDCRMEENTSSNGGAIGLHSTHARLSNLIIRNNFATGGWWDPPSGGGIAAINAYVELYDSQIRGNRAEYGGGFDGYHGTAFITTTIFEENSAESGSAVYLNSCDMSASNTIYAANDVSSTPGGTICSLQAPVTLTNSTIVDNIAAHAGGAVYSNAEVTLSNCIVWNNGVLPIHTNDSEIRYSDIQGGWPGDGNIDIDPSLRSRGCFDFLTGPDSPCVDTGDPSLIDAIYDRHPLWIFRVKS